MVARKDGADAAARYTMTAPRRSQPRIGGGLGALRPAHFLLLIALAMRLASAETANFSYLVLAGYALLGGAQAIQALALSWLFTMVSPGIAPVASAATIGRYAVLAGAALSMLLWSRRTRMASYDGSIVLATLTLGVFLVVHSAFVSPEPDVSILKAISWTVVMVTALSAWARLDDQARTQLERQLFGGLLLLMLLSVPVGLGGIGYLVNGTGFQGALNHPQAMGPTAAIFGAWVAGKLLATAPPLWRYVGLLGMCLVLVVMSEARTAGAALVLGVASAVLVSPFIAGIPARRLMPALASPQLHGLVMTGAIVLLFVGAALSSVLGDYLVKRGDTSGSLLDAAEASRGALVYTMIANFEASPLTGIGFGIASDYTTMVVERDPVLGLPTSASIEKGVLPIAVLEELGIFGAVLVAAWLWMVLRRGARSGVAAFAVLATIILTNLGEATLFSPSGMGLLPLVLLAWAVTGTPAHLPGAPPLFEAQRPPLMRRAPTRG